jgi:hypothetical protein
MRAATSAARAVDRQAAAQATGQLKKFVKR